MPRLNTAADKELPEDLPQELWAAERVWVRCGAHMPPLSPLYDGPYKVLQHSLRHFRLQMGDREDKISTSRLKPCTSDSFIPTAAPSRRPGKTCPPPLRRPSMSASTSHPYSQRQLTLELFLMAHLPGFCTLTVSIFKPLPATQPRASRLAAGLHLLRH
jgi:hypothetical protein